MADLWLPPPLHFALPIPQHDFLALNFLHGDLGLGACCPAWTLPNALTL
jgi:hypothetical protein